MAIYTGGKSKAISSPRHLTLRHARRKTRLSKIARGLLSAAEDDQPVLKPGEEKLNSFWAPGLEAGPKHIISATQTIKSKNQPDLVLTSEQDFYVDAPQFSLPEGSVYSVFPPSGYPEDANILPHVVLSDPHLPWERRGSPKDDHRGDKRNKVPWLVLFSFTQEELKLAPDAFGGSTEIKQTPTLAVNMTVGDLWDITGNASSGVTTPITKELGPENIKDARGDFIFVKPDLFKSMFSTFDDNNTRVVPSTPDTTKYKYLAHVRNINTTGMAEAGKEDVGIFSVVVGSRAGVLANTAPTAVSVHLISIEGVEEMTSWADDKKYVALCSLHSWNYTVNPPGTLNVHDAFVHLGETLDVLRTPDSIITPFLSANDKVSQRLAQRLQDGYSLVKYRVQTGEKTLALYRGPFTPTVVAPQGGGTTDDREVNLRCSNSGQDLQVLDREVGLMDVSYSVAWQVGRMLALGDQGFAAALVRHRVAIQGGAMKAAKVDVVRGVVGGDGNKRGFRTRTELLADLKETAGHLGRIHLGDDGDDNNDGGDGGGDPPRFLPGSPRKRWHRPRLPKHQYPPLHFNAPDIKTRYLHHATNIAHRLAQSKSGPGTIYDETNDPVSTDWMQILAWILDRMFLAGIPSHYLLTDPSHLPQESLRFFYIDPNWVDALIDGALSLGNHMGEDRDRVAIKQAINTFLHHVPEHQTHAPQIPTYGFYLRSDLVTMFPDLKVSTEPEPPKGELPDKAPLLRHEIVADGVMLGLLDRLPDPSVTSDFQGLCFTQPPHQQRFAVGYELSAEKLSIDLRHQYTVDQETRETDKSRHKPLVEFSTTPTDTKNWFTWSSDPGDETKKNDLRVVRLPFYAEEQTRILMEKMDKKYFDDDQPNAALLGMQLNDAFYRLVVSATEQRAAEAFERIREGGPPKVRALGRLGVSYIRRDLGEGDGHDNEGGDTGDGGDEPEIELEVTPPSAHFQRHPSYRPHPSTLALNRSPHVRNLPIPLYDPAEHGRLPPTRTPPNEPPSTVSLAALTTKDKGVSADKTDPAGPPIFSCYTFTSGYGSVQTNADPLPQDMIFSIQATNTASSDYQLIEFQIWVPLGTVDNPDSHCLFPSYSGPGARMLSNLRFNVLPMLADMQGVPCLVFRLLPRSASGWTSVRPVRELSFLLCLATPNGTYGGGASTLVTLYTAAYYKYVAEKTPVQGKFVVALKKNEDV